MDSCSDSFSALQKIKRSSFNVVVMDHKIAPLDPFKLMDYILNELQKEVAMVIVDNSEGNDETGHKSYLKLSYPIDEADFDKMVAHMNSQPGRKKEHKLFSLDYLEELSDNNRDFIEESIQLFVESVSGKLKELEKSISVANYGEAREIAHNVKPTFAMLGNDKGRNICHKICHDAGDAEIPDLAKALKDESVAVINEIEKEFPQLKHYEKENLGHRG